MQFGTEDCLTFHIHPREKERAREGRKKLLKKQYKGSDRESVNPPGVVVSSTLWPKEAK